MNHCKIPMEVIGTLDLSKKVHIGFPLHPGRYRMLVCAREECRQVSFIPITVLKEEAS